MSDLHPVDSFSQQYSSGSSSESDTPQSLVDLRAKRVSKIARRPGSLSDGTGRSARLRTSVSMHGERTPGASKVAVKFKATVEQRAGTAVRLGGQVREEERVEVRLGGEVQGPGSASRGASSQYEVAIVNPANLPAGAPPNNSAYLFYTSGNASRKIPVSGAQNQQDMSANFSAIKHLLSETNPAAIQVRQRIFERQVDQGGGVIVTEKYDLVNRDSVRALLASNTNRNIGDIGDTELDDAMEGLDRLCTQSSEILQRIDPFEETGNVWKPDGVGDLRAQHPHEVLKRFDSKPGFQHRFIRKGMHKLGLVDVNGNLTPNGKNALREMAGSRAYIKAEKERLESELLGHRRLPRTPHIEAEIQELEQQLAELNNLSQVAMDWMIMQANRPKAGTTLRDWLNRADTTPAQRIAEAERSARALQMVVEESRSIGKKVKGVFGWSESEKITKEESLAHGIYFFNQPVMEGQGRPIYLHFCEKNHVQAVHDPEKERDVINVVADVVSDPDQVDQDAPDAQGQVMARDMSALTDTLIGNDASPSFQRCFKDLTPGGDLSPF